MKKKIAPQRYWLIKKMFLYKRKRQTKPFIEYETFDLYFFTFCYSVWQLFNTQEHSFAHKKEEEGV